MNIRFTSRHEPLEPELREFCAERLKVMSTLLAFAADVDVITSHEKNRHRAEIHIVGKGGGLLVDEEGPNLAEALHRALDHLDKKLKKERAKFRDKKRRGGREHKIVGGAEAGAPSEAGPRVVRAAFYTAKLLTIGEAMAQFDAKKREVLMFRRAETESWAVLFRRKDGRLGLVEPE